jgi:hypothetical protein
VTFGLLFIFRYRLEKAKNKESNQRSRFATVGIKDGPTALSFIFPESKAPRAIR